MSQSTPEPDPTLQPEATVPGLTKVKCPRCGEMRGARVKRRGFFQKQILPFFGYFPWECGGCRFAWISTTRGEKKRRRIGRGPKAYKEPSPEHIYSATLPTPVPPPAAENPTHIHDNQYEDDTHEDVG